MIAEISQSDIRVRVFGKVAEVGDGFIILEDDTGKIRVDTKKELKKGDKIRVFGRPQVVSGKLELAEEIVQDMEKVEEKLYKKAMLLIRKGGS